MAYGIEIKCEKRKQVKSRIEIRDVLYVNETHFSNNFIENGFLLAFKVLRNQGFPFLLSGLMVPSRFEHDLFINVSCRLPQTPVVSCISRFG